MTQRFTLDLDTTIVAHKLVLVRVPTYTEFTENIITQVQEILEKVLAHQHKQQVDGPGR